MEQETFTVHVKDHDEIIEVVIRTTPPDGPENIDHEIWINGKHAFTINPHLDVCDEPCWQLKEEYQGKINLEFVSNIGMEIERHYL
jgi:hypothetical protein